jgi:hypothetical protein
MQMCNQLGVRVLMLLIACVAGGCAQPGDEAMTMGISQDKLAADNGMTSNGLVTNGLVSNGLVSNGLVSTGLISSSLATGLFATWFNSNPTQYSDMVMRYLVQCSMGIGQSLTWTNPGPNITYSWNGKLGLAPSWTGGAPASEAEQQVISACLAAHVNKYGVPVVISVQGSTADGAVVTVEEGELANWNLREGCFFGNLFTEEGIFVGNDGLNLTPNQSASRTCSQTVANRGASADCSPMVHIGSCSSYCVQDDVDPRYTSCTYNDKEYLPVTTRLEPAAIYTCGDGICQVSESCGTGNAYNKCMADCGTCS